MTKTITGIEKVLVTIACVAFLMLYMNWVIHAFVAFRLSASPGLSTLQRAIRFEPLNADYRNQLGRYFLFVRQDANSAIENYKAALRLNPHAARYWLNLAEAYQLTGDIQEQHTAMANALRMDPTTPDVAWEAANLYLAGGDIPQAFREFQSVIEHDPQEDKLALKLCWHATHNVDQILTDIVAANIHSHFAFLDVLMKGGEVDATPKVWSHLVNLGQFWDASLTFPYLQGLLDEQRVEDATKVWQDLVGIDLARQPYLQSDNVVVNSSFELPILNGGFDWRYQPKPQVKLAIETLEFHTGKHSLSAEFAGEPAEDIGVFQYVAVYPNTAYEFSGYMKTENIESGSGPRFAIQDAYTRVLYFVSSDLIGSNPWQQFRAQFKTNANSKLLTLKVVRAPGDLRIRGKVWIDDLRLVQE